MYDYYAEFVTRYPEDGSRGNYAYAMEGEAVTEWRQSTIEPHGISPVIKSRALERIARTLGERDALNRGGSLI